MTDRFAQAARGAALTLGATRRAALASGAAAAWLLIAAAPGAAQPRLLETVVVSAAARPVPFENIGRAVTVLTREEIARLPVHSVGELLRYAASVEVRARGAHGMQSDFGIRGAAFGQTLVLVNGVRINDAQSGHHNGDIPVGLADVERIEILHGTGSSLYGADAFGGTVNVITRRDGAAPEGVLQGGQFDTVSGTLRLTRASGEAVHALSLEGARSTGFMYDRGFETYGVTAQSALGPGTSLMASYLWKDFGANGSYGPAPSREWTNQTWLGVEHRLARRSDWTTTLRGAYRTHGDHFIYDIRNVSLSENRHRTHAGTAVVHVEGPVGQRGRLTLGGEAGGDWLRSTNLGDRAYARGSLFAELQQPIGGRTVVYPGVRYDRYADFGGAWSPSIAISTWIAPAVKVRASAGRAFRVPTFTELYYHDPNHLASAELGPERAWSVEGGIDYLHETGWVASATVFTRRERDVIDWVRPSPDVRWRTTNIRRLTTSGVELGLRREIGEDGTLHVQYTGLTSDAEALSLLSKYALDYAPHSLSAFASVALPAGLALGQRIDYRYRNRGAAGAAAGEGRDYWVLDTRLSRAVRNAAVFVEVTNLLAADYQEILGVQMPGRWIQAGVAFGR